MGARSPRRATAVDCWSHKRASVRARTALTLAPDVLSGSAERLVWDDRFAHQGGRHRPPAPDPPPRGPSGGGCVRTFAAARGRRGLFGARPVTSPHSRLRTRRPRSRPGRGCTLRGIERRRAGRAAGPPYLGGKPGAVSGPTWGSQSRLFGRYQFQSPSSFMLAGSSTRARASRRAGPRRQARHRVA